MNTLLNAMKEESTHVLTENGGKTYSTSNDALMDLFAFGGSYRSRSDEDCIFLFKKAYDQNKLLALKCLFYLYDVRGGQGERRFFYVVIKWLATYDPEVVRKNLMLIPEYGRWDMLYAFVGTPLQAYAFEIMRQQFCLDLVCETPSLLGKWLKSMNTSSEESCKLGSLTAKYFGLPPRAYRKALSSLREKIRVVERLMSANRWDEIRFDQLPSKAGLKYRNAFARRDIIKEKYKAFAQNKDTKVNAGTLNPCDVVLQARLFTPGDINEETNRLMINKYWDNLNNYFHDAVFNGVAVVDTSGSMEGCDFTGVAPIDVAIALGMYCGEKCNPASPWANHYITFSREARLIPIEGIDFVDKVDRIYHKNLCENTNIRSVFDLLLRLAVQNHVAQEDMPQNIVVISDMEFDSCASFSDLGKYGADTSHYESEMEAIAQIWENYGYELPKLVFWNVNARQDNIPMRDNGRVTFVSGYSPVLFESILSGKTGIDLVLDKLNSDRYANIRV